MREGTTSTALRTFLDICVPDFRIKNCSSQGKMLKPGPESGLDCLMCAEFARNLVIAGRGARNLVDTFSLNEFGLVNGISALTKFSQGSD